jgi:hypothetical protein
MLAGKVATGVATAAQWLWNAALTANPIGLVIAADRRHRRRPGARVQQGRLVQGVR